MGFMDRFLDIMRLNDEDDYEFDNEEYEDDEEEEEYQHRSIFGREKTSRKERDAEPEITTRSTRERKEETELQRENTRESASSRTERTQRTSPNKITPINNRKSQGKQGKEDMEVCVIKPTTVEEEREITETLLKGRAVVINMEGLDVEIAQRIIDFTSGSTFAIQGNLQKISNYVFIATPQNVDISGDFQTIMDASL